jgi:protein-tyrosine phosphatase
MRTLARKTLCLVVLVSSSPIANSAVTNPQADRVDKEHVVISWEDPAPVSVYQSDRPDAGIAQSTLLSGNNHDGRYRATVATDKRYYFLLRDTTGDIRRTSERLLPLEHGSNFRDIGGYATTDGKHVRWGLMYRSAATPLLSDRDVAYIRTLGLHSMTDLRSTEERELAPTRLNHQGIQYIAIDYPFKGIGDYESVLTVLAPQYRAIFRELLAGKGPISYNCTAGQDRTGIATALILSSLGVPRQTILDDYHLSTEYREPQNEMPVVDPSAYPDNPAAAFFAKARLMKPPPLYAADGRSWLGALFDKIDARWGSVENYLQQSLGVGPTELARLRAAYLE